MSVPIQLGPEAFRFDSFQHWVNKAQSWFVSRIPDRARVGRRYLCIDAAGRVCMIGGDFMRARDEGTFPVVVYLIDSTPVVAPTNKVQMPDKARAGIEVLHQVVESLLTTSRYVDEEGEATQALADLSACIADPPFRPAPGVDV